MRRQVLRVSSESAHPPLLSLFLALGTLTLGLFLLTGPLLAVDLPLSGPLGSLQLAGDSTTGLFLLLVGLLGTAAALAGHRHGPQRAQRFLFFLFLLGLALVPLAGDVFTFLVAWELMSLAPGLLLILDAQTEARRAGVLYISYAQISALLILTGLLWWVQGGDASFDLLLLHPPPVGAAVCLVLGAAMKAGLMPFHLWLPEAHPAAPSHVSALMSGAMVTLPAYLVLRFLLPHRLDPAFGLLLLLAGGLSAALGSLHALHARNLKRVLAMTTVAHMGVLFSLLGLGLLLVAHRQTALVPYVSAASLAYLLTHGLSKGALFLVAGEVHHATHELDLERLGGLWRATGGLAVLGFLGGFSLAGLPPFGGFPSELALFATFLATLPKLDPAEGVAVFGSLFLLGLAAGAGLAAIAKIVYGAFHGPSRVTTPVVVPPLSGLVPALLLIAASLLLGLAPGLLWAHLPVPAAHAAQLPTPLGPYSFLPLVLGTLGLLIVIALLVGWSLKRPQRVEPWACGGPAPSARQTYTPQSLVMPYRVLFAEILRPASDLSLQETPVAPFAPSRGRYDDPAPRFVEKWAHQPLQRVLAPLLSLLRRLHRSSIHFYLTIALALLLTLLFLLPVIA